MCVCVCVGVWIQQRRRKWRRVFKLSTISLSKPLPKEEENKLWLPFKKGVVVPPRVYRGARGGERAFPNPGTRLSF